MILNTSRVHLKEKKLGEHIFHLPWLIRNLFRKLFFLFSLARGKMSLFFLEKVSNFLIKIFSNLFFEKKFFIDEIADICVCLCVCVRVCVCVCVCGREREMVIQLSKVSTFCYRNRYVILALSHNFLMKFFNLLFSSVWLPSVKSAFV